MCDLLIPALLGLGLLAAGSGGDSCDNGCYSACSTCGSASYGANGGYGYTPTYAPTPSSYAPAPAAGKHYTPMASYNYSGGYAAGNNGYYGANYSSGYNSNYSASYGGNSAGVSIDASGGYR